MKVGVNLINFGEHANPEFLKKRTLLAEELGYHFVMISDHVAITPDVEEQYEAPFFDPLAALAWLAGLTSKVELGTTVLIVPYRHPLLVAQMGTAIDRISDGRFILGAGIGWARGEFEALGLKIGHRGPMTDDYLRAVKEIWTGEVATYRGRFASFEGVRTGDGPVRKPHPPIWIGGNAEPAMRRAVKLGDGWHPINVGPEWLENEGLPRIREIAREEDRPVPGLHPRILLRISETPIDKGRRPGEGSIEQIEEDLRYLERIGAGYVLLDTNDNAPDVTEESAERALRLIAEEVLDLAGERLR